MALGGVPNLADLGLDGMGGGVAGMGVPGMATLGRSDEDERKRRLGIVLDILKVGRASGFGWIGVKDMC